MAPKKNITNPSTGKGEFIEYDDKRLRHMSADELRDYYDRVEPLSNDEVDEIYDRIIPKITYEIASSTQQEKPRRLRSSITKIILIAVCLTLMLSVVAQALGVPLWEMFVTWTQENFHLHVSYTHTTNDTLTYSFSDAEIETWGDDVYNAFIDIGVFPALPRHMPDGFRMDNLYYFTDDYGYAYLNALYRNDISQRINLIVEIYTSNDYSYESSIEYDQEYIHEIHLDGITYQSVSNLSNNAIAWYDTLGTYTLTGNVSVEVLEDMIYSIDRTL